MARQNTVRLYGVVSSTPEIAKDINGKNIRGIMRLSVLRSSRGSGEATSSESLIWDYPLILSVDEDVVNKMSKLKQFDIVELEGPYVTRKVIKNKKCPHCGKINSIESTLYFVMPTFMAKRNTEDLTVNESMAAVIENREISNGILILGNLCNDVNYYENGNIKSAVYQIGTERKRFVTADDPVNKADFPIVRTFGRNAYMDNICIHKGSMVFIDGYLHSKNFERISECEDCGNEFTWGDSTMEIVPYVIEYLTDFRDPEDVAREEKEAEEMEADRLLKSVRGF